MYLALSKMLLPLSSTGRTNQCFHLLFEKEKKTQKMKTADNYICQPIHPLTSIY